MERKTVEKQIVGIDISKDSFYVCYMIKYDDGSSVIKGTKSFENTPAGFIALKQWCEKRNKTPEKAPVYIMEATGIYYENLYQTAIKLLNLSNHIAKMISQFLSPYLTYQMHM